MNMKSKMIIYGMTALMLLGLVMLGCGSGQAGDPMANLNGEWKDLKTSDKVTINLAGDPKTVSIADQKFTVVINKSDGDMFIFDAKDASGKSSALELVRQWDDNGSTFTLELIYDGGRKKLRKVEIS
jgi:hypothetical protein